MPGAMTLALALAVFARVSAFGEGLARGPYIVAASSTSAQICWRFHSSDDCHVFDGLQPDTTFPYSFGGSEVWTGQTLPASTQTLTFDAFGDLGANPALTSRLSSVVQASGAQMVVILGDAVSPSGEDAAYDAQYLQPFRESLSRIPFFTVVGDSDYGDYSTLKKSVQRFQDVYSRVQHKPAYYSFDAGPAHFVALDTNSALYVPAAAALGPKSDQQRWLERDLGASKARWKIVLVHVPLYSTMRYNGEHAYLRQALEPIFRKHGVDLVLQSNDRVYERSKPIGGVVYVTAGTGGGKLDLKQELKVDWLEKRVSSFGLARARVSQDELRLDFLDDSGDVRDTATLKK